MGCDIHGYWEAQTPDGAWVAFYNINGARSYVWFGIIANVRSSQCSLTADRGIPDDASSAWNYYCNFMGRDLHSHTWLSHSEIKKANKLYTKYVCNEYQEEMSDPHEATISADTPVRCLYMSGQKKSFDVSAIPWTGTVADLVGATSPRVISSRLRYVCAFDN